MAASKPHHSREIYHLPCINIHVLYLFVMFTISDRCPIYNNIKYLVSFSLLLTRTNMLSETLLVLEFEISFLVKIAYNNFFMTIDP